MGSRLTRSTYLSTESEQYVITKITTNIKSENGEARTFELAQRTLIVGPSASGKSAIVNALELGTARRMSDYLGRPDAAERTVQDVLTAGAVEISNVVERTRPDEPVGLPYESARMAILSNPLDANILLLGERLDATTRELANELRTVDKQRKELTARIKRAEDLQEYLKNELEMDSIKAQEKLLTQEDLDETELQGLNAKSAGLKDAVAMGVRAAWTPDVLKEITARIPPQLGTFAVYTSGEALSLRLGLSRNGAAGVRWALSGSEWNIVVTALAHLQAPDDTYCVIPADRAIDEPLLVSWMKALSTSPAQVLLTAITEPAKIPAGWEVLRVGAKRARVSVGAKGGNRQTSRKAVASKPRLGVRASAKQATKGKARR